MEQQGLALPPRLDGSSQSLPGEEGALAQCSPPLPAPQLVRLPAPPRTLAASSPPEEAASSVQSHTGSTAVFIGLSESVLHKLGEKPTLSQKQLVCTRGCTGSWHCGRRSQHAPGLTGPGEEAVGPCPPYRSLSWDYFCSSLLPLPHSPPSISVSHHLTPLPPSSIFLRSSPHALCNQSNLLPTEPDALSKESDRQDAEDTDAPVGRTKPAALQSVKKSRRVRASN